MAAPATVVEVKGRELAIPFDCPCCGATPDTEVAVPLARASRNRAANSAMAIDFPYCRACVAHVTRWESGRIVLTGLVVLGTVLFAIAAIASQVVVGIAVFGGLVALGALVAVARRNDARRACRESCGSVEMAVEYLGWSGVANGFAFKSIAYGAKFAERNASRLVEDARVSRLLKNYELARIAVPTPAAPVSVIPPPLDTGEWIAKLTTIPTRVARRDALSRALDSLSDARARDQVVRTVCAIELATYLAPVDQASGAAAKKRRLQATIEHVKRDNLPEPLRQLLLRELEDVAKKL
jgi:hypothetical protein